MIDGSTRVHFKYQRLTRTLATSHVARDAPWPLSRLCRSRSSSGSGAIRCLSSVLSLLEDAATALANTGWNVHRAETIEDVGDVVASICRDIDATTALRSGHEVLDEAKIYATLEREGVDLRDMTLEDDMQSEERAEARKSHREEIFKTDVGITGGDYVIAETGTLVIHPRKGVSRLTSLAPPVHIAVIKRGQVLPSLDELFLLEHVEIHTGNRHAGMNLISGPSRTGDIEATIVHGIHGPVETHIVLVG